ncbi:MAG: cell division protein ZapD [Proteobacteria bacterium]|nr:cell division protein ZapD [Pseudomonadota bacterium]
MTQQTLTYEHPLTERLRTFLRAEYLFQVAKYRFSNLTSIWDARDCVANIIEVYNLVERTEFRSELSKELERHTNGLQRLAKTPSVDHKALDKVLRDLEKSADVVKSYSAKQGIFPQHSELLNGVRQRLMIPGGTCSFDLPAFHYWLNLPPKTRQSSLNQWMEILDPLDKALNLVLELTRQSSVPTKETAHAGTFQKTLSQQSTCQLIRVRVRSDIGVFPEISANKHRVNIRFLFANFEQGKPALSSHDIPFELTCSMIL